MTDATAATVPAPAFDWKAAGFDDQDEVKLTSYCKALILGPPKLGKTTAVLTTAPGPVAILNGDGPDALTYPIHMGAKFQRFEVTDQASWRAARLAVGKAAEAGAVKTVVVDTITFIVESIYDKLAVRYEDSRERYRILKETVMGGVKQLLQVPAHVFFIAHLIPAKEDGREGVLPLIQGASKYEIAGLINNVVRYTYTPERNPQREFVLGPQGDWTYGGRNIKRSMVVPATVPALLEAMGINP